MSAATALPTATTTSRLWTTTAIPFSPSTNLLGFLDCLILTGSCYVSKPVSLVTFLIFIGTLERFMIPTMASVTLLLCSVSVSTSRVILMSPSLNSVYSSASFTLLFSSSAGFIILLFWRAVSIDVLISTALSHSKVCSLWHQNGHLLLVYF